MSDSIMVSVIERYTQGVLNSFTQIYYYYESSLPVSFKQYYMVDSVLFEYQDQSFKLLKMVLENTVAAGFSKFKIVSFNPELLNILRLFIVLNHF